jgi:hypothetical protein
VPEYRHPAIREVIEGPDRVINEVSGEDVRVLAVIHGARLLPARPDSAEDVESGDPEALPWHSAGGSDSLRPSLRRSGWLDSHGKPVGKK